MGWLIPIAAILLLLVVTKWITGRRKKSLVLRRIANRLVSDDDDAIAPRSLVITVVFTNLNDFMTIFGELGDEAGVPLLNEYYGRMTPIIRRHGGYLNTFQFDRLFFFFGPMFGVGETNYADDAIATVLEMQKELEAFNDRLRKRGWPQLKMRAGIATGTAIVGDIGSAQFSQFTAVGPVVNLATKLERLCKGTDAGNLISNQTRDSAGDGYDFRAIELLSIDGEAVLRAFEATVKNPGRR